MSWYPVVKRGLDIVAVVLVAPIAVPVGLLVAAGVWITSGRPVLYRATRVGRGGSPFAMYKFRTMVSGTDGPGVTRAGDVRVTPLGARLRRLKLDELPQLYHVLRGDMSLVGPRPEEPRFVCSYTDEERRVLAVRPGVTGAATLEFRHEEMLLADVAPGELERTYVDDIMRRKLAIETRYLSRRSLRLDAQILVRTLAGLRSKGAGRGSLGRNIGFNAVTQAAPMLTAFALAPYLIHHLGVDRFGVWSLILSLLVTFSDLDGGVGASLARFFAIHAARRDATGAGRLLTGALVMFLALGLLISCVALWAAPTAVDLLSVPSRLQSEATHVLLLLGPIVTLALVADAASSLLQANGRFRGLAGTTVLSCVCFVLSAVIVVDRGWGLEGLLAATALRFLIVFVVGLWLGRRHLVFRRPLLPGGAALREFRGYAVRMQLSGLTNFLNGGVDALVIAALLPIRYVAVYAIGLQAAAAFRSLPLYAFPPILTRITTSFAAGGLAGARRDFSRLQSRWLPASLAYGVITATAVPFIVLAWVGPRFLLSGIVATLLLIAYTVHVALTAMRTCFVRAIGRPGLETRYAWLATVLNIGLTALLAVPFGVIGVVAGTALGLIGGSVYFVVLCRRTAGLRESRLPTAWYVATGVGGAVTLGAELLAQWAGGSGVLRLAGACLPVLAGLAVVALLLVPGVDRTPKLLRNVAGSACRTT